MSMNLQPNSLDFIPMQVILFSEERDLLKQALETPNFGTMNKLFETAGFMEQLDNDTLNEVVSHCCLQGGDFCSLVDKIVAQRLNDLNPGIPGPIQLIASTAEYSNFSWETLEKIRHLPAAQDALLSIAEAAYKTGHKAVAQDIVERAFQEVPLSKRLLNPSSVSIFQELIETLSNDTLSRYLTLATQLSDWGVTWILLCHLDAANRASPEALGLALLSATKKAAEMPSKHFSETFAVLRINPKAFEEISTAILNTGKLTPLWLEVILRELECCGNPLFRNSLTSLSKAIKQKFSS